ncbi:MAG: hypothetical protein WCV69_04485 [Patescibacteria group bacterium]|jgi:hypothetical protein
MLSIKKISKKNIWLFIFPVLLLVVVIVVFRFLAADQTIKNKNQYLKVVRPKLEQVISDPKQQNIVKTKDFLFNIKSSDRSIGDYHLPLYMAFSLWTKYTESRDLTQITKAMGILEELKSTLPELDDPLSQIIKIMKNNV